MVLDKTGKEALQNKYFSTHDYFNVAPPVPSTSGEHIPIRSTWVGKFGGASKEDDKYLMQKQTLTQGGELGYTQVNERDYDIWNKKAEKADHMMQHEFSTLLVDEENPESQKKLANLNPQIFNETREAINTSVEKQIYIWKLIQQGGPETAEELEFLRQLMARDQEIPMFPLWDINGAVSMKIVGDMLSGIDLSSITNKVDPIFSLWRPVGISFKAQHSDAQQKLKAAILKRCFPGLRKLDIDTIKKTILPRFAGDIATEEYTALGPGNYLPNQATHSMNRTKNSGYNTLVGLQNLGTGLVL